MHFLNCVSSLKTGCWCANNKRNTILRYWHWIHFVIWSSVYALRIYQYFFRFFAEWNCERERRGAGDELLDSYLKNVVKFCSVLHWLKTSMQPFYFKGASTLQRIVIWAPHRERPLKGDKMCIFKRVQALSIKLFIQCTFL